MNLKPFVRLALHKLASDVIFRSTTRCAGAFPVNGKLLGLATSNGVQARRSGITSRSK